jgi:O-acetylhomoserine/O-acetylserine sulfhydrylase-like pyridoxal-dependent enzyme
MNGTFNFTSGTFKIALYTNAATLDATTTAYTSSGEVVASGYTAGGLALTVSQVPTLGAGGGSVAYISFSNAVWNAALTARGALIYESTTGNPAVCVLDFGADKTSTSAFTVQFPATNNTSAIIRIA